MKKFFKNVEFEEATHKYTVDGKEAGLSTTGLIEQYSKPFDADFIAPLSAKKRGISVEEILAEWDYTRDYACERGNQIHLFAQGLWSGLGYYTDYSLIDERFIKDLKVELPILQQQAIDFYNNYKDDYEFIEEEQFLYNEDFDLAGSIDLLLRNKKTGEYVIVDFKTYGTLHKKVYNKMKVPLQEFNDDNITHLSFQTEVYKQMFEIETDLTVGEVFGIYFSVKNESYEVIKVLEMSKEIKKILENRRRKNMNSVPVLIYGKSGTGKSTSLRNFTENEVAVINVLNKPLPFRSNIKAVAVDDYDTIIKGIKGTKKKIVVIDDAGYLLSNEAMKRGKETGYVKFTDMAMKFFNLIEEIRNLDGGKTVYIMLHEELDDVGNAKLKLTGKMLDQQVCIEGCFTIAFRSMCSDGKYIFRTHNNGQDITKSPFDMFEEDEVDNDLKAIDKVIREYYELDKKIEIEKEGEK